MSGDSPETLMRFALCPYCFRRERLADDAEGPPRLCNGCGAIGVNRFIGVTDQEAYEQLLIDFPAPTVDDIGRPIGA